ncbi:MAG: sigma-70 family RNA polymerase sigma factor [bacterium]
MFKSKSQNTRRRFEEEAVVHTEALYRAALRMTKNESDAQDLIQETMLRAYKNFDRFEEGTNCRAWLFKIMTNTFINIYRSKQKESTSVSFDDVDDNFLYSQLENATETGDPERDFLAKMIDEDVVEAIEQLPPEFRMVVVLAFYEGYAYQEIAEILDIQVGTVKSRLHRGRKMLQKLLWQYAQDRKTAKEEKKS